MIINGEGEESQEKEGPSADSNCVCKEVAVEVCVPAPFTSHTLDSGQCGLLRLALESQEHSFASSHVHSGSKLLLLKIGNKGLLSFFPFGKEAMVSTSSLQTFRNKFCDWGRL